MKKTTYAVQSQTPDGTVHDVGTIILEGSKAVFTEMRMLDTEEIRRKRIEKLSAYCKIAES